jgi:diaminohydroxyphosphoribosylaminopyrimidine deaminase/5-amino-6-(5-phosphoribosylamino)uracil reductase
MARAITLARRGEGWVEPNPMVGAVVIADDGTTLGEGWHKRFGGDHAEVMAIMAAGPAARGATLCVSLEPCCHVGKTPPCTDAIIAAGLRRVVVAARDPSPHADGAGLAKLAAAGIAVEVGLHEAEAVRLTAPFRTLVQHGRPWIIAKWAMSLDGKVATHSGESRWISSETSRKIVHELRSRVDGIMIGVNTAIADDPLLTARPPGPRTAVRIVLDSDARLTADGRLVATAREVPVLVMVGRAARDGDVRRLRDAGCEVFQCDGDDRQARLSLALHELGRRRLTNVLVEGGMGLLGGLFDLRKVDEVWSFIAPKVIGGEDAFTPVGGRGVKEIAAAAEIDVEETSFHGGDVLVRGLCRPKASTAIKG